jgi:hypothetical protein
MLLLEALTSAEFEQRPSFSELLKLSIEESSDNILLSSFDETLHLVDEVLESIVTLLSVCQPLLRVHLFESCFELIE